MMPSSPGPLIRHLPAIYHASEDLRTVLSVLEAVLLGTGEKDLTEDRRRHSINEIISLEDKIALIATLFDAYETPKEFVPWLARWVALTHLDGLTEMQQRQLLAEIVPLYAKRGTKQYLERLLEFFTPQNAKVEITDQELPGFVVGTVKIGLDSRLEPDRPFWFVVKITVPAASGDPAKQQEYRIKWEKQLQRVVDLAKPAHTLYELRWQFEGE